MLQQPSSTVLRATPDSLARSLCWAYCLVRNHSFIDGNKRVAFLAMVEMAERNEATWNEPAGTIDEATFVRWVKTRVT